MGETEPYSGGSCEMAAWSGSKQQAEKESAKHSTFAALEIKTLTGLSPARYTELVPQIAQGIEREWQAFRFMPKPFQPPTYGADFGRGYAGSQGRKRYLRAYWGSMGKHEIVQVTLIHTNRRLAPVQLELNNVAAIVVPAFGL
jgi:hypothetical protein